MQNEKFHNDLKQYMDSYVHCVYDATLKFPREELFGVTSQIRRASLSVVLNYVEGYARKRKNVLRNFLEISYGSLKESAYLLEFSLKRKYLIQTDYEKCIQLTDTIGKMLWGIISKLETS